MGSGCRIKGAELLAGFLRDVNPEQILHIAFPVVVARLLLFERPTHVRQLGIRRGFDAVTLVSKLSGLK